MTRSLQSAIASTVPSSWCCILCAERFDRCTWPLSECRSILQIEEINAAGGKLPVLKEKAKLWLLPPPNSKAGRRMQAVVHAAIDDAKHVSHANVRHGAQSSIQEFAARARAGEQAGAPPEIRTRPRRASLELRDAELKKRCIKHLGAHFQGVSLYTTISGMSVVDAMMHAVWPRLSLMVSLYPLTRNT